MSWRNGELFKGCEQERGMIRFAFGEVCSLEMRWDSSKKKKREREYREINNYFFNLSASWIKFWRIKFWPWRRPKSSLGPKTNCGLSLTINDHAYSALKALGQFLEGLFAI